MTMFSLHSSVRKRNEVYKGEFYNEYQFFLKEGICQDYEFQGPLSKLLYFETNKGMNKDTVSLDEYVARCPPEQKDIYYLHAPSRSLGLQSPYLEAFEKAGREVLFVYSAIDDFVMANLEKFEGRPLVSIDKANIDLGTTTDEKEKDGGKVRLGDKKAEKFCAWFKQTIGKDKVATCKVTNRLGASPAVVVDTESGAMRRMMAMVSVSSGREIETLPKQQVEINPSHPVIVGLNAIRDSEPTLAKVIAEQVFDNCLIAAGLLDDSRSMLPRLEDMMTAILKDASSGLPPDESVDSSDDESSSSDNDDEAGTEKKEDSTEVATEEKKAGKEAKEDVSEKESVSEKNDTSMNSQSTDK
jgi:TNF receptor-associated protein 1